MHESSNAHTHKRSAFKEDKIQEQIWKIKPINTTT